MSVEVIDQQYHRNGSGGDGFVVSLMKKDGIDHEGEPTNDLMMSVSFFEDDEGDVLSVARTATFDVGLLAEGNIKFGVAGNSHRAEYYGPIVKEAWERREHFARLLDSVGLP